MKLTYEHRKRLPGKSFVFPGKRSYPINDISHARNALARVAQNGSPAQQARVRAAVHKKFPSVGAQHKGVMKGLMK